MAWRACAVLALATLAFDTRGVRAAHPIVAIVKSSSIPPFERATAAIVETLHRSSVQPDVLTFDLASDEDKRAPILRELHRRTPALIVTVGSLATTVVLGDPSDVPVVFSAVLYPEQSGFVTRPGRGVTGASIDLPLDRQFNTLRRLLPHARRIGVLYDAAETGVVVDTARGVATAYGFTLVAKQVSTPGMAVGALAELMDEVDAVWSVPDSHVFTPQTAAALFLAALRKGVPMIGLSPDHVRTGAVAAVSCDYRDVGVQTALLATRILRGKSAAALPPASPRKVLLALNLRTARRLGLALDPRLARDAGEVIR